MENPLAAAKVLRRPRRRQSRTRRRNPVIRVRGKAGARTPRGSRSGSSTASTSRATAWTRSTAAPANRTLAPVRAACAGSAAVDAPMARFVFGAPLMPSLRAVGTATKRSPLAAPPRFAGLCSGVRALALCSCRVVARTRCACATDARNVSCNRCAYQVCASRTRHHAGERALPRGADGRARRQWVHGTDADPGSGMVSTVPLVCCALSSSTPACAGRALPSPRLQRAARAKVRRAHLLRARTRARARPRPSPPHMHTHPRARV